MAGVTPNPQVVGPASVAMAPIPPEHIPAVKAYSDIQCYKRRMLWTQGAISADNNQITITVPNEDMISLYSRIRFTVKFPKADLTGASNTLGEYFTQMNAPLMEFGAHCFFQRIVMKIGGTAVFDQDMYHLQQSLFNALTDEDRSRGPAAYYGGTHRDHFHPGLCPATTGGGWPTPLAPAFTHLAPPATLASYTRRYERQRQATLGIPFDIPLQHLKGALFNQGRVLLPTFLLPKIEFVFYANSVVSAITPQGYANAGFEISNFELGLTYYTGPSIRNYFSTLPSYQLAFIGVANRQFAIQGGVSEVSLQIPSNYRSLRAVVAVFRDPNVETSTSCVGPTATVDAAGIVQNGNWSYRLNKHTNYWTPGPGFECNARINGFLLSQQNFDTTYLNQEIVRVFGTDASQSTYFKKGNEMWDTMNNNLPYMTYASGANGGTWAQFYRSRMATLTDPTLKTAAVGSPQYIAAQAALDAIAADQWPGNPTPWNTDGLIDRNLCPGARFVLCLKTNCSDQAISGARLNQMVSSLELIMRFPSPPPNLRMDVFLLYDTLMQVQGGRLTVTQ